MPIYAYDPRLVKVEDTYYIIWCQDFYGAADSYVGLAFTTIEEVVDYIKEHSVVTTSDTEEGRR